LSNHEGTVDNVMMVFDPEDTGVISFRELLILFSMSMEGSPRDKLHWAFRLYDQVRHFVKSCKKFTFQ
jgi:Ca2+-binding EF-hand superfamily protein